MVSDIYYELDMIQETDYANVKHLEYEVLEQGDYIENEGNEFDYLFFNCHFFFIFHGGNQLINFKDFIDIEIYKFDNLQNFKNIYCSLNFDDFDYINKNEELYKEFLYNLKNNYNYFNNDYYNHYNYSFLVKNLDKERYYFIKEVKNIELYKRNCSLLLYKDYKQKRF